MKEKVDYSCHSRAQVNSLWSNARVHLASPILPFSVKFNKHARKCNLSLKINSFYRKHW